MTRAEIPNAFNNATVGLILPLKKVQVKGSELLHWLDPCTVHTDPSCLLQREETGAGKEMQSAVKVNPGLDVCTRQ